MREQLRRIPFLPRKKYFPSVAQGALTFIALGSRLII